nr:hypothetical protein [Deinococcus yavapaiensis]
MTTIAHVLHRLPPSRAWVVLDVKTTRCGTPQHAGEKRGFRNREVRSKSRQDSSIQFSTRHVVTGSRNLQYFGIRRCFLEFRPQGRMHETPQLRCVGVEVSERERARETPTLNVGHLSRFQRQEVGVVLVDTASTNATLIQAAVRVLRESRVLLLVPIQAELHVPRQSTLAARRTWPVLRTIVGSLDGEFQPARTRRNATVDETQQTAEIDLLCLVSNHTRVEVADFERSLEKEQGLDDRRFAGAVRTEQQRERLEFHPLRRTNRLEFFQLD